MKKGFALWLVAMMLLGIIGIQVVVPGHVSAANGDIQQVNENALSSTVIASYDFEDGTVQGWRPNGSGKTEAVASSVYSTHSGGYSLLASGRTASWNGPSVDVSGTLQKDGVYQIAAYVKAVSAADAGNIKLTVKRTAGGADHYEQVSAAVPADDSAWVKLEGSYTYTEDSTSLMLYIESDNATASYVIDDISITGETDTGLPIHSTFEDGTAQGWASRLSSETVTATSEASQSGSYSLKVTGRTAAYSGAALNVSGKLSSGTMYRISAWAKLLPGETPADIRLSLQAGSGSSASYTAVIGNTRITDGEWVRLSANYLLNSSADDLSLYFETSEGAASFYVDEFELSEIREVPIQTALTSVYEAYSNYFPVGAAIEEGELTGLNGQLLSKHFNHIVAGNSMKWDATEPSENVFDFARGDLFADYARARGIQMRGHTLLWHSQVPDWLFKHSDGTDLTNSEADKDILRARLENHIKNVVEHFNDVVDTWDVVNEVIDDSQPDGFRHSKWYEILGPEYIDDAFIYAKKYVRPGATLVINDYGTTSPKKRQFLYDLVKSMKERGIPVDGVGHQMHNGINNPTPAEIEETLNMFAGLGVENQVTELDISVYPNNSAAGYTSLPKEVEIEQAYYYRDIFKVFKKVKDSAYLTSVTLWGLSDAHTWLTQSTRTDYPLLFDQELQAKLAYWAVVDPSKLPVMTKRLEASQGTPVIDGQQDNVWAAVGRTVINNEAGDQVTIFKTLWDAGHLYVYAKVNDPVFNPGDKVELYLDGNNAKGNAYDGDDVHYTLTRSGEPGAGTYRATEVDGGYIVEAQLPLDNAALDREIGFDIRVTDADRGETSSWNDPTNDQDNDPSKFGTLALAEALKLGIAAGGTPVIDGVQDEIWAEVPEYTTDTWVEGANGATAAFKAMWDNQYLYVFAHVTDTTLSKASVNSWEQDSIEIFLDQNNGKTASYEADDGQYRVNYDNEQSYGGAASSSNFTTKTRLTEDGYDVEAAIKLDKITPEEGGLLGFDLQVNDDQNGDGKRDSVAIWNDPSGMSWSTTAKWGNLLLKSASGTETPGGGTGSGDGTGVGTGSGTGGGDGTGGGTGGGDGTGSGTTTSGSNGTGSVTSVFANSGTVQASAGGTLRLNGAVIVLPAGALGGDGTIKVTVTTVGDISSLAFGPDQRLLSQVYEVTKDNTGSFLKLVTLSLPFDKAKLGSGDYNVVLCWYNEAEKKWVPLNDVAVDIAGQTVSGKVSHFTKFAVLSDKKPEAASSSGQAAASLSDIRGHWAESSITYLVNAGIIKGYPDHSFRPDGSITRAEFITMLAGAFKWPDNGGQTFADTESHWAKASISAALAQGVVNGYGDDRFGPNDLLTREQMAALAFRAAHLAAAEEAASAFKDSDQISEWARSPISVLVSTGLLNGYEDGSFEPQRRSTRAEAAALLAEILQAAADYQL
ncbi:Endo-1,4-beta-xylanase A precursor [compost metagenome]